MPVEAGEIFVTFKVCGKNQSISVFKFWCVSKCRYESKLNFFLPRITVESFFGICLACVHRSVRVKCLKEMEQMLVLQ